jgi:ABC-type uncharacterized transport system permease subunit
MMGSRPALTKLPVETAHLTGNVSFSPGGPTVEETETRELEQRPITKKSSFRFWEARRFITVGSLGLAIIQGVCATAVFLSGIGTALGFSSLIAATAAGPATGLHANRFRITMLAFAGLGAAVNLMLLWNAERIRRNPSARWRMRPLTRKERWEKWIQLGASVLTLLLIAGELLAHPLFHHEL